MHICMTRHSSNDCPGEAKLAGNSLSLASCFAESVSFTKLQCHARLTSIKGI